jgi:hypothetical protein
MEDHNHPSLRRAALWRARHGQPRGVRRHRLVQRHLRGLPRRTATHRHGDDDARRRRALPHWTRCEGRRGSRSGQDQASSRPRWRVLLRAKPARTPRSTSSRAFPSPFSLPQAPPTPGTEPSGSGILIRVPASTARRFRFADGAGELGFVSPVSELFCSSCDRIRLTAYGQLRTCLGHAGPECSVHGSSSGLCTAGCRMRLKVCNARSICLAGRAAPITGSAELRGTRHVLWRPWQGRCRRRPRLPADPRRIRC